MGGARATAWRDTLEGANLSQEERIAREAIQNSADATRPNEKTEVVVRTKTLSAADAAGVRDALALRSPGSPIRRLDTLGLPDDNALKRIAEGAGGVRTTTIEDWNTFGLGYDPDDGKDRFDELCLYLGQDSASVDAARGGSYGFGKTVYEQASDCRTFIVYSVFEPSGETGGHYSRLFVCSHFIGHKTHVSWGGGGKKYTGRAWLGIPTTTAAGVKCDPVTDEEAARLAKRLGFAVRSRSDLGTSIMILGSNLDLGEFRKAVEDYWWPRIESNMLTVQLIDDDNSESCAPEPLTRDDLKPYIRCYYIASNEEDAGESDRKYEFNRNLGVRRGTLGLTPLGPDDSDGYDDEDSRTRFRNAVALIRSGPRMVVRYMNPGGRLEGDYAGVFLSHPEAEEYLHLSEPPSHDDWIPNSARLKEKHPGMDRMVGSILRTIRRQTAKYQRELSPPPKPTPMGGTDALKRILASVMSGAALGNGSDPPAPSQDPFSMTINERRTNSPTQSSVRAEVEARLKDDAPMERSDAVMSVRPTVAMDDNLMRGETIGLSKVTVDGEERQIVGGFDIPFEISKNRNVLVEIESENFGRDLYADLEVSIRTIEPDAADDD